MIGGHLSTSIFSFEGFVIYHDSMNLCASRILGVILPYSDYSLYYAPLTFWLIRDKVFLDTEKLGKVFPYFLSIFVQEK